MHGTIPFIRRSGLSLLVLLLISAAGQACTSRASTYSSVSPPSAPLELTEKNTRPQDEVIIGGTSYPVPPPWTGNKIVAPEYGYEDFRQIPVEYTHMGSSVYIVAPAHGPLVEMLRAAAADGMALTVESAYRSERYQKRIFQRMLAEGRTFADIVRYVAPPGYSQHVLGTAVDFYPSNWRFADTPDYAWLKENGQQFGFHETYSQYNRMKMPWEAWHWNYTGSDAQQFILPRLVPASSKKSLSGPAE